MDDKAIMLIKILPRIEREDPVGGEGRPAGRDKGKRYREERVAEGSGKIVARPGGNSGIKYMNCSMACDKKFNFIFFDI
jgi:hypothetical protein